MSESASPRSLSPAFRCSTQVVGPQSNSAGPVLGLEQIATDDSRRIEMQQVDRSDAHASILGGRALATSCERHSLVSTTSLSPESIFSQLAFECSAASAVGLLS